MEDISRHYQKRDVKPWAVFHNCNPRTWEGSNLGYIVRPCLKKEEKSTCISIAWIKKNTP
jgi:hypothetical protein